MENSGYNHWENAYYEAGNSGSSISHDVLRKLLDDLLYDGAEITGSYEHGFSVKFPGETRTREYPRVP